MEAQQRDQIKRNSQTKLGLLMLGSPGKVLRLSGAQQAEARRKSFRSGYNLCDWAWSTTLIFQKSHST